MSNREEYSSWNEDQYEHEQRRNNIIMESNQKKVSECSPDDRFTVDKIEGVWGAVRESETEEPGYLIERKDDMGVWWLPADTIVTVIAVDVFNKELPVLPEGYKYTLCQVDGDKKEMSYEEACKWATEALEKEREEIRKGFSDMIIFNQEKYHVSKDGIEHIPVDPTVGPDTPISVIPAWGEVEKEAWTSEPIGIDVVMTLADGSKQVTHIPIEQSLKSYPIVYQSLEEILQDMIDQKRPLTIMNKLQDTIDKGYYINTRPTE